MPGNSDDLILKIEVDEEKKCYTITVYTETGRKIEENEFIMEVEMWMSEIARAETSLQDPDTKIH